MTDVTHLDGKDGVGNGAARWRSVAMALMAALVLSFNDNNGKVCDLVSDNKVTMSEAAERKWSLRDVTGSGMVVGKKATVSDTRTARVAGI